MSLDSEAGPNKEMNEIDDRNDWTFLDDQKDVSQVEDVSNIVNDNTSENSEEEEEDDADAGYMSM